MKKTIVLLLLVCALAIPVAAGPSNSTYTVTIGGINGYIIAPSAVPVAPMSFNINVGGVFVTPLYIPLSIAFSFVPNWEIGFGHQFAITSSAAETPFIISTKYRFIEGIVDIAVGAAFEIPTGVNTGGVEVYAAFHSNSVFGKGVMDIVIGKTFPFAGGIDSKINLYIGTLIPIWGDLFLVMIDFSNNALGGATTYMNTDRGVFNFSFIFDIIPKTFSIYFACYDFMDAPFGAMGVGIDWRLKL